MNETVYQKKEAIEKLNASLEDIEKAKEMNITEEQRERLLVLETIIPEAIKKIKKGAAPTKLHELINDCAR